MPDGDRVASCFMLKVKPEYIDEYRELHAAVWPDMLRAIRDAGWSRYTIFMREDGTVVGYLESDDLATARERIDRFEVSQRWGEATAHLFQETQEWLQPIFNLDEQLFAIDERLDQSDPYL